MGQIQSVDFWQFVGATAAIVGILITIGTFIWRLVAKNLLMEHREETMELLDNKYIIKELLDMTYITKEEVDKKYITKEMFELHNKVFMNSINERLKKCEKL